MIHLNDVLRIHEIMIQEFGGGAGVRDLPALESALARPFATFGGEDLLPSPEEKASAIIESILINHPFIDGNKRTGYVLMRLLLLDAGFDLQASEDDKYDFVIGVASGKLKFDQILAWLKDRIVKSGSPTG